MTYKLTITFDGVVAIGPAEPYGGDSTHDGPLFAVMPRGNRQLSRWSTLHPDEPPRYIPLHTPVLITDLEPSTHDGYLRKPDDIAVVNSKTFYIWYPMRERLVFSFDNFGDPGTLIYKVPPSGSPTICDTPQLPIAKRDLRAVPDMREIWPERCNLRKEMLDPKPSNQVVGQVLVPYGVVDSGNYGRAESAGTRASFEPARTPTIFSKCLVPEVEVSVDVAETVRILSYSLDTGKQLDAIEFNLTRDADILVGNADPGDIPMVLKNIAGLRPRVYADRKDLDFELYYPLFEGDDDGGGLPAPRSTGSRFGDPHCYVVKTPGTT